MTHLQRFSVLVWCSILVFQATLFSQDESNYIDSKLYEYINDGSWCWFQDERAVVDAAKDKLVIGTANMNAGVDLIIFDIKAKKVERTKRFGGMAYPDDHNSPGMLVIPNGNYLALWAHHYEAGFTRYSVYNGSSWSAEKHASWKASGLGDTQACYSNVYTMTKEKRIYNFGRVYNKAPNFMYSDDNGNTWKYGGQITTNKQGGYTKGYYKYWGNGVDCIDVVLTEAHPREFGNSIYHGYIKDRKMHDSKGKVLDSDIYDRGSMPSDNQFTKVFANGTKVNGITMNHCWQSDIVRYDNGTIAILFKARANGSKNDHRNFYARFDGSTWKTTYIGKAGKLIYSTEGDYTGLGALCPDDPNRIYLSSPFDPGNDNSQAGKREIWRGTTNNKGASWKWEAVTAHSSEDNFRPIVPKWKAGKEALLWFRGTYTTAQKINAKVVGTFYDYGTTGSEGEEKSALCVPYNLKMVKNPGHHQVAIHFSVSVPSSVQLAVYTVNGKNVATLVNQRKFSGSDILTWNTRNIPAGIYLIQLTIGNNSFMQHVTIQQ